MHADFKHTWRVWKEFATDVRDSQPSGRHYAEHKGYWEKTNFMNEVKKDGETTYYDSVTGKPLFIAPRGRTMDEFLKESKAHGWPSFRDEEVVWENMRTLKDGEAVSVDGTHLGHNLPDKSGNRYVERLACSNTYPQRVAADWSRCCMHAHLGMSQMMITHPSSYRVSILQVLHQPRVGGRKGRGIELVTGLFSQGGAEGGSGHFSIHKLMVLSRQI